MVGMNTREPIRKPGVLFIGGLVGTIVGVTVAILVHDAMQYRDFRLNDSLVAFPFIYFFAIGLRQFHDRHGWDFLWGLRAALARAGRTHGVSAQGAPPRAATDHTDPRAPINLRRLQLVVSAILTVAAVAYGVYVIVPTYRVFAEEFSDRRAWKAAGWDDEEVRRKANDMCIADCKAQPQRGLFPNEDLNQCESSCSRPGWDPWKTPAPPWWEIPIAFIKSESSMLFYVSTAVIVGPWLFAFLLVRVLPAGVTRFWRWLRAPADVH